MTIATAVAVDADNNVIVTGYSEAMFCPSHADYATIKYSSAGVPLWTNRYYGRGSAYDRPCAVAVDGSNNVIVTGYSTRQRKLLRLRDDQVFERGRAALDQPLQRAGELAVTRPPPWRWTGQQQRDRDGVVDAAAGAPTISRRSSIRAPASRSGPTATPERCTGENQPCAVAVDGSNNVIVTGVFAGPGGYAYDYATIKYSSAGVPLWTNRYNGPGNGDDYARAVAVDASNNVIVTGSSGTAGSTNYATIKYSSAGVPLWTNRYSGPGSTNDCACAVAVDGSDNVIVTGYSWGGGSSYDYATIRYSSAGRAALDQPLQRAGERQ